MPNNSPEHSKAIPAHSLSVVGRWTSNVILLTVGLAAFALSVFWYLNVFLKSHQFEALTAQQMRAEVEKLAELPTEERIRLIAEARQTLTREPTNNENILYLIVLETLEKNTVMSEKLTLENSKRSARDTQAQLFAINRFMELKDYKQASIHFEKLARAKPNVAASLFPILHLMLGNFDGQKAVIELLNNTPPWRLDFFYYLVRSDKDFSITNRVLSGFQKYNGGLKADELSMIIKNQLQTNNAERAYFIWLDSLNEQGLRKVGNLFDGQFDLAPANMVFDWNISNPKNGSVSVMSNPVDVLDRKLQIDLNNSVEKFNHVTQTLRLSPGTYTVSFDVETRNLKTDGGLRWIAACQESRNVVGQSDAILATTNVVQKSFSIEVPKLGCGVQNLQLISAGVTPLDLKISGRYWFDNIDISSTTQEP